MNNESRLAYLYLLIIISSIVTISSTTAVWLYWQKALNTCYEPNLIIQLSNCGCIFYGKWSYSSYFGGNITFCQLAAFSSIPGLLWSASLAMIYGYKACITNKRRKYFAVKYPDGKLVAERDVYNEKMSSCIFLPAILSICFTILMFSTAVVMTDGFFYTCREYKKSVVHHLKANGNMAVLIHDRLSCGAMFDFMDFLQPDPINLDYRYRRGSWLIHTSYALYISLMSVWITVLSFGYLSVYYIGVMWKNRKEICCSKTKPAVLQSDL